MFGQKSTPPPVNAAAPTSLITEPPTPAILDSSYKPVAAASITLVKVRDLHGSQPVGMTFAWSYKWTPEQERLARARKAFEAATKLDPDFKGESLVDWELMK
jgi:hypothetical protein